MSTKNKKDQISGEINIGSKLIISEIKKVHQAISKVLAGKNKEISLRTDLLETIDFSGIQLLIWTKNEANRLGIKFNSDILLSPGARDLIDKSGFSNNFN